MPALLLESQARVPDISGSDRCARVATKRASNKLECVRDKSRRFSSSLPNHHLPASTSSSAPSTTTRCPPITAPDASPTKSTLLPRARAISRPLRARARLPPSLLQRVLNRCIHDTRKHLPHPWHRRSRSPHWSGTGTSSMKTVGQRQRPTPPSMARPPSKSTASSSKTSSTSAWVLRSHALNSSGQVRPTQSPLHLLRSPSHPYAAAGTFHKVSLALVPATPPARMLSLPLCFVLFACAIARRWVPCTFQGCPARSHEPMSGAGYTSSPLGSYEDCLGPRTLPTA